jgi:hypothetical protein
MRKIKNAPGKDRLPGALFCVGPIQFYAKFFPYLEAGKKILL